MVNVKKNVLTQKQAEEENVGTYHHPTEKTWRSGACVIGEELREGHYRSGYTTKSGKKVKPTYVNASCAKTSNKGRLIKDKKIVSNNEFRKEILTEKQALNKPVGSYYHPNETTWRSGACPIGEILKNGYKRNSYMTKTGKVIPETYVNPICIKDKGEKGKKIKQKKNILNKKVNTKILKNNLLVNNKLVTDKLVIDKLVTNKLVTNKLVIDKLTINNKPPNNKPRNNIVRNNILANNTAHNNKLYNNKVSNNTILTNNTILSYNKVRNNTPLDNLTSKIKINNNKSINKLYNNIEKTNVQEITNKMIINLMKNNKL